MPPASASAEALDSIGYRGEEPVGAQKLAGFVELHIEQGPMLEAENKTIGVVDSGQGMLWYDGKITGFESHAGTTPMPLRRDALATLSEFVLAMERIASKHWPERGRHRRRGRDCQLPRATSFPAKSPLPSIAAAPMPQSLDALDAGFARRDRGNRCPAQGRGGARSGLAQAADHFDAKLVDAVENAASRLGYTHRRITSGAGHDACNLQ